jgi:hypothetical protein
LSVQAGEEGEAVESLVAVWATASTEMVGTATVVLDSQADTR